MHIPELHDAAHRIGTHQRRRSGTHISNFILGVLSIAHRLFAALPKEAVIIVTCRQSVLPQTSSQQPNGYLSCFHRLVNMFVLSVINDGRPLNYCMGFLSTAHRLFAALPKEAVIIVTSVLPQTSSQQPNGYLSCCKQA
ncbi:hypothetical protein TNCV_4073221 [Trichonephila clavipes]|uniref:Uncharacterized protein n=1 Tax=Trichonephila clavipes TaxID=2585209 RepID=A0A8X6W8A1_TRICX|nr:hypothetical protein TNCV_4073221 [Trichonephila clavipes]